jgi:hypothetical protein
MLDQLVFAKLAIVITVIYAGMNLHQLTSSHAYLVEKIEEFRLALAEMEAAPRLMRLNLVFYVALPMVFLAVLHAASVAEGILAALAIKFAVTAGLDIRSERRILAGLGYTPMQHGVSRLDNAVNLAAAAATAYLLLR